MNPIPKLQIEDTKVSLANLQAQLRSASKALSMAVLGGDLSAVEQTIERLQRAEQAFCEWRDHVLLVLENRHAVLHSGLEAEPSQLPAGHVTGGKKTAALQATGGKKTAALRQEDRIEPKPPKLPAGTKTGGKKSL